MTDRDRKQNTQAGDLPAGEPQAGDPWAARRSRNVAVFSAILALAALFFVITILRMS